MHRLLERLDRQMTVLVPLTYLVGLFLGTAAYFSGLILNAGVAVGIALAFAVEVHGFLEQRRVRLAWTTVSRIAEDDPKREVLDVQLRLHIGILVGLVLFSIGNGIAFWASVMHPLSAGTWVQVAIRGAVIPLLFLTTGALAPISSDAAALLSQAADDMLYSTVRTSVRQWKRRVKQARKSGVDLAPLAVALMLDAGETDAARRIQLIADGLVAAEQGRPQPPTGGGTPLQMPSVTGGEDDLLLGNSRTIKSIPAGWPDVLNLPSTAATGTMGAPAPSSQSMSPEEVRVRAALREQPDLSVDEIVAETGVAKSTASKIRRIVLAERAVLNPSQRMAQ